MPQVWPEEVYDYLTTAPRHPDIADLDLEEGKWFQCKYCKNPRDVNGKFNCRTAFSAEQIMGKRGHVESNLHKEKKALASQVATPGGLASLFKAAPPDQPQAEGQSEINKQGHAEPSSGSKNTGGSANELEVALSIPCAGLGWEITEPTTQWYELYKTYLVYVDGAEKASKKFLVESTCGIYIAKSRDCTGVGLKGFQHGVKCCKPCHGVRCDKDQIAKLALMSMDKLLYSGFLMSQRKVSKSDIVPPPVLVI